MSCLAVKNEFLIIRATALLGNWKPSHPGCYTGEISIKVGNMVPACCECNPGGSIADKFFAQAPLVAEVWAERCGPQPRPAAGGE
jgi:hypothetical protein